MSTTTETQPGNSPSTDGTTVDVEQTWRQRAKQEALNRAQNAAIRARTEARSVVWRNRWQLAPLAVPASSAAIGTVGALAAEHSPEITALAAAPSTGAVALASGWWAWRRYANRIPADLVGRAKAGLAAGCAWCATLPLTGADSLGMWWALGFGTVGLAARWWQRHRPGYPTAPAPAPAEADDDAPDAPAQPTKLDASMLTDQQLLDLWNLHVGCKDGPLAGAAMSIPHTELSNGRAYQVQLNPGKQTITEARTALPKIAGGLRTTSVKLGFEPATDHDGAPVEDDSLVELRVIDRSPVADGGMVYPGPRIVRDDKGGVHIALGPFADGEGMAQYTLFEEDSMRSGLVVGTTGSGKSRLLELICIALRELGVEIWFLDPQEGQSSPALAEHADWYLPGLGDDENPHGHIEDLLRAMKGARSYRSKKLGSQGARGFTHTPQMPGIMVVIDEASDVFNAERAPGVTYGVEFGEHAKKFRKNGIGMLAVGHVIRLETFGGSKQLRSSLMGYNTIALRTAEPSEKNSLPTGMPDPATLPPIPGYGYIISSASQRLASYRSWDVPDVDDWLAARPAGGVDTGTAHAAGEAYVRRREIAEEKRRALARELAALENGEIDLDEPDQDTAPAPGGAFGGSMTLPSITGGQIHRPTVPAGIPAREIKPRERELLDLLAEHGELSTTEIATHLGITDRAVRKIITALGETYLSKNGHRYRRA